MVMPPPHQQHENRSSQRPDPPAGFHGASRGGSGSDPSSDRRPRRRAVQGTRSTANRAADRDAVRLTALARRLSPRDRWLIRMLFEHRVLTTHHIHQLAFPGLRTAQVRLRELHQLGVLDRFQPHLATGSAPLHFVLGPAGAAVLAAEHGLIPGEISYRRDRVLTTAHYLGLAHTIAVNTFFTDLIHTTHTLATHTLATQANITGARSSRTSSAPAGADRAGRDRARAVRVQLWWSEARCVRYFGHHVRPDGYAQLTTPPTARTPRRAATRADRATNATGAGAGPGAKVEQGSSFGFFLEFDMGTENLARLAGKIHGYHALARTTGVITPVLIVLARHGRERGARDALARELATLTDPNLVPLATTAFPPRTASPPRTDPPAGLELAAPVWLPVQPRAHHTATSPATTLAVDLSAAPGAGRAGARRGRVDRDSPGRATLLDLATLWPTPSSPHPYLTHEPSTPIVPPATRPGRRPRLVHLPAPAPHPPATPHTPTGEAPELDEVPGRAGSSLLPGISDGVGSGSLAEPETGPNA